MNPSSAGPLIRSTVQRSSDNEAREPVLLKSSELISSPKILDGRGYVGIAADGPASFLAFLLNRTRAQAAMV